MKELLSDLYYGNVIIGLDPIIYFFRFPGQAWE